MHRTVEAEINSQGEVRLPEFVQLAGIRRALVTILDTEPAADVDVALLSEAALAEDWNRGEEDSAWSHLQQARPS